MPKKRKLQKSWYQALFALLLWTGVAMVATAKEPVLRTEANVAVELSLTARQTHGDPFNQVMLDVTFIDPKGGKLRVPAFWAGTNVWKVRYASPIVGTHRFHSECSETR